MTTTVTAFLDEPVAAQVTSLLAEVADADGVAAVSEQFRLRLDDRTDTGRVRHAVARNDGRVIGYGVVEQGNDPAAELAVAADQRRQGIGTQLLSALRDSAGKPLHVWAHGDLAPARDFLSSAGATEERLLLELRRPAGAVDVPSAPDGVLVRTFVPGQDDEAWLRLNAEAFALHPEQGAWTRRDLDERLAADWFDPRGFFVAERDGQLVAFHWTKQHSAELGEVYVVGVSPRAQGLGLGRLMTATGLAHLDALGVAEISLYVDGDNTAAVALYRSLDFHDHHRDSQWLTA